MPVSSAHCVTGSTTSAIAAVSDITTSQTTSRSSASSRVGDVRGVGRADHDVGAEDQQRRGTVVGAERVEQLVRRPPGAGQRLGVDAPHAGDVRAGGGVVDPPVARQLVGLLPVLAPALAVALAGEAAVARAPPADHAEREGEVDPGQHGVGAGGVLLGAAGGQDHHLASASAPSIAASSRSSAAAMPVTRSTRSGHHEATESFTSSQPVVRAAR